MREFEFRGQKETLTEANKEQTSRMLDNIVDLAKANINEL